MDSRGWIQSSWLSSSLSFIFSFYLPLSFPFCHRLGKERSFQMPLCPNLFSLLHPLCSDPVYMLNAVYRAAPAGGRGKSLYVCGGWVSLSSGILSFSSSHFCKMTRRFPPTVSNTPPQMLGFCHPEASTWSRCYTPTLNDSDKTAQLQTASMLRGGGGNESRSMQFF